MSDLLATMGTMQSEQARQRKRERKRLEREKKRRRGQAGLPDEMDLFFEWRPQDEVGTASASRPYRRSVLNPQARRDGAAPNR